MNYQVTKLHVEDVYTDSKPENRLAHNSPPDRYFISETEILRPCGNYKSDFENYSGLCNIQTKKN